MTTTVKLRGKDFYDVEEANDHSTQEALMDEGWQFDKAIVDRFDGLLLTGAQGSWHFQTPLCGYGGNRPQTTAEILEMFDFGSSDEMFAKLNFGGNTAQFSFYR